MLWGGGFQVLLQRKSYDMEQLTREAIFVACISFFSFPYYHVTLYMHSLHYVPVPTRMKDDVRVPPSSSRHMMASILLDIANISHAQVLVLT